MRRPGDVVLTVTRDLAFYLYDQRVDPANLEAALRRDLQHRGSDTVLIRADKDVARAATVDIIAVATRAGARNTALLTEPPEPAPSVPAAGRASARGRLDKELIRGTIRVHLDEVKTCYESQLVRKPGLGGRVMVRFTIAADGAVADSELAEATLLDDRVTDCLVKAVRGWEFPKPDGGIVIVSYPFVFTPGGGP
jgi:TonB family protein